MATSNRASLLLVPLLLLLLLWFGSVHSRSILGGPRPPDPVSDGASPAGGRRGDGPPYLLLPRSSSSSAAAADDGGGGSSCDQTYGFMPCTTSWLGNVFLILVYGYLMFTAATYLSNGSELLLEILGPGIIGGFFLPILGALPDAMLILGQNTGSMRWVLLFSYS